MSKSLIVTVYCSVIGLVINNVASEGSPSFESSEAKKYKTIMLSNDHGIRGYRNFANTDIMTFLGIPYVLPPTGKRRFEKPHPMPVWKGVKDALELSQICPQDERISKETSEDCLYLNVFTPNHEGSVPVMVWIHGGGWAQGSGNKYDFTRYAEKGVVVVSFNYRLSVLGFGSTDDDVMPGNFGLLDQVEALQWIQKNIHAFGGDPNRVTIFGNSAGSTSISLHILSPLSVGLFQRAIMQSGSSLSLWGVERNKAMLSNKEATAKIAVALGCLDTANSTSLIGCMRNLNVKAIMKEATKLEIVTNTMFIFMPRVETTFGFLPDYPEVLLDAGKFQNVDTMSGFTASEAAVALHYRFPYFENVSVSEFKEGLLEIFKWCSFKDEDKIVDRMVDFFLQNTTDPNAIVAITKLYEAANELFNMPTLIELRKVLLYQNVPKTHHLYQFDFVPNYVATLDKVPRHLGLPHARERQLLFYSTSNSPIFIESYSTSLEFTPQEKKMADQVQNLWTNFAMYGNPLGSYDSNHKQDVHWPPYTLKEPLIAHIDTNLHLSKYTKLQEIEMYWAFIDHVNSYDIITQTSVLVAGSILCLLFGVYMIL